MGDFIERTGTRPHFSYELKPGLSVDTHMHMDASKNNVEAMGKYYFDKPLAPHTGLGPNGNQNYHNYYGEWALNVVDAAEKSAQTTHASDPKYVPPKVDIDLQKIGLDKAQINTTLHYTDTSPGKGPAKPIEAAQPPAKGPFGDPALDKAFHAVQTGNDAHVTHAAHQLQNSADGQRLTQTGNSLLAEQQRQEQPAQTQTPAQQHAR